MKPMTNFYVTAAHLPEMQELARVSSFEEGKRVWTELAVYRREGFTRPFVAVVEGKTTGEQGFIPRFKYLTAGTLDRALNWFEGSALTTQLYEMLPEGLEDQWPTGKVAVPIEEAKDFIQDSNTAHLPIVPKGAPLPKVRIVGYPGEPRLLDALAWLYPENKTAGGMSVAVERDFGMPARTVRHAMSIEAGETTGKPGSWVQTFIAALRYFDRELWVACRAKELADG